MAAGQLTAVFSYTAAENLYGQASSGSLTASAVYGLPQKSYGDQPRRAYSFADAAFLWSCIT